MLQKLKIILTICFLTSLYSCLNSHQNAKSIVEKWMGVKIYFPSNIIYKSIGVDTVSKHIVDHSYKILVYVDSTGCTGCRLGLPEWKAIIDLCQSKGYDVGFLFIVQSSNYIKFEQKLDMYKFTYPIIFDLADNFNNLNKFPNDDRYRTFLLDKDNKVVLIGSPIHSDKMWELYFNILSKTKNQVITQETYLKLLKNITSVNVVLDSINLGKFNYADYKQVSFKLSNTGSYPLIIQKVNTSCGCTVAKYDKKPIAQGETTNIILEYKPNSLGYFRKIANVVCNIPKGSVRLTISGEVTK